MLWTDYTVSTRRGAKQKADLYRSGAECTDWSSSHSKCACLCALWYSTTLMDILTFCTIWGLPHIVIKRQRESKNWTHTPTGLTLCLFHKFLMFIWMFGKWRGAENVSGLRSLSSIHQAWDRDGRGSAAGQRLSSYSPSHTYRRTHRHTHIHPGGMQHSMPPCIKVWVWMWVCVCVQIYQMSTFWSPAQREHGGRDSHKRKIWELNMRYGHRAPLQQCGFHIQRTQ